jgi:hypothetical protein
MYSGIHWKNMMEIMALSGLSEKEFTEALSALSAEANLEIGECFRKLRDESFKDTVSNTVN